jgi:hypothetical protein
MDAGVGERVGDGVGEVKLDEVGGKRQEKHHSRLL